MMKLLKLFHKGGSTNSIPCTIIKAQKKKGLKAIKIYRIKMVDDNNCDNYMRDGYNYRVIHYDVEAENKEQALAITKRDNPSYFFNKDYVREVAERTYTTSEKDHIIARIAELEKSLAQAKEDLKKFN